MCISVMVCTIVVMISAMSFPPHVTTVDGLALPCAGMAAIVLRLLGFVMVILIVVTALTNQILGQIATIAQRGVAYPAQVFLVTVESFAMESQHVQIGGMNYYQPASPKLIL